ncbi:MAG: hypothetical protein ACXACY_29425 [Candidatus Hodarchaeales archaeon]|jgi:hypothetical protein
MFGKTRSILYKSGKFLGDINAIAKGKIGERLAWRLLGKIASILIRGIVALFKS